MTAIAIRCCAGRIQLLTQRVTHAGAPADVSFSLYYAPPEAVHAYTSGQGEIQAHPSADVWSLGVRTPVLPSVIS